MKNRAKNGLPSALLGLVMYTLANVSIAEIAVIVHLDNVEKLDKGSIAKIYLGKVKRFSNGKTVLPLDQKSGSEIRVQFLDAVVGKTESQMKAYWSRLIFTGKGVPPQILENDAEVKNTVSRNQDSMGFIDAASVDTTVKVLATF